MRTVTVIAVKTALTAAAGLVMCACDAAAPSPSTARPIRTVQYGYATTESLKTYASNFWLNCRTIKDRRVPTESPPLPPDSYFEAFHAYELEELFTPGQWARFETYSLIAADLEGDCELVILHSRSGKIEHACSRSIAGAVSAFAQPELGGSAPKQVIDELEVSCEASEKPATMSVKNLPQVSAGMAQCVWLSDIAAAAFKGSIAEPLSQFSSTFQDTCLYSETPTYAIGDEEHHVVLKIKNKAPLTNAAPDRIGWPVFQETTLKAFSHGTEIPSHRFARSELEDFLKRPLKQPVQYRK